MVHSGPSICMKNHYLCARAAQLALWLAENEFVIRLANTAYAHSKEIVSHLKNALANDEAARKELAASRERSGGVPDVGLASILRKQTLTTNSKETSIDITNKLIQAEKNNLIGVLEAAADMSSKEVGQNSTMHKIYTEDHVTEMLENDSDNACEIGIF